MDPSYNNSFSSPAGGQMPQAPVISSGKGDVVLPSSPKAKRKWPIVVGVLMILIAIGAGVGAWLISSGFFDGSAEQFSKLVNLLEQGQGFSLNETDEQTDLIFAVRTAQDDGFDSENYYKTVNNLWAEYKKSARGKVGANLLDEYEDYLKILENSVNVRNVTAEYLASYKEGLAQDFYDTRIACDVEGKLGGICAFEEEYYAAALETFAVYKDAGCNNGDVQCAARYYGAERFAEVRVPENEMTKYKSRMQDEASLRMLSITLKDANAKMMEAIKNA